MIISGQKILNFLNQTGDFGYNFSFKPDTYLGSFSFGLSGNKNLTFKGSNGKIYDSNDNILYGYTLDDNTNVRNLVGSGKQSLYVNSNAVYLFQDYTGYNFNNFIINTNNCNLDIDLSLSGESTILQNEVITKRIKNLDTGATVPDTFVLTGLFTNTKPDLEVKIFDAVVNTKAQFYSISGLPVSFYNTANYYIITNSGNSSVTKDTFNATFYTNFGNINYDINLSGEVVNPIFSFLQISPNFDNPASGAFSGQAMYPNSNQKFIISYANYTGATVKVNLDYVSGATGIITGYLTGSGSYNGLYSGFLTGSGSLSSIIISPTIFSGGRAAFDDTLVRTLSGVNATIPFIATGKVEYSYSITGTGIGDGYIYPDISGSGYVFQKFSGYVPYVGGGNLIANVTGLAGSGMAYDDVLGDVLATGILQDAVSIKTVLYTGLIENVTLNPTQYTDKTFNFTPNSFNTDITGAPFTLLGTGYATGNIETGIVDPQFFINFKRGYYEFVKPFTNISGQTAIADDARVITGWQNLITCKEEDFNFLIKGIISGTYTGYSFLDVCDDISQIPTGIIVTSNQIQNQKLYRITGGPCELGPEYSVPTGLNFVIIRPTEVVELDNLSNENIEYLMHATGGLGIRTRISLTGQNISGSGYFSGLFGDCGNDGIWEHVFSGATERVNEYLSSSWMNNFKFDVVGKQDDGQSYFSEMQFNISGRKAGAQQYNLTLQNNNDYVSNDVAKESLYKLILYKKAKTDFSGIYESNFIKLNKGENVSLCTGLTTGEYLLRAKYIHKNTENSRSDLCCCRPIQILNLLDTNITNFNAYDDFYSVQHPRMSGFMKAGGIYHQIANYYYNERGYSGHNFTTGYNGPYSLYMQSNHFYADPTKQLDFLSLAEDLGKRNQNPFGFFNSYEYAVPWLPNSVKTNPALQPYIDINTSGLTNWYNSTPYTRTGLSNVLKVIPNLTWFVGSTGSIKQINIITNRLDFPYQDKNKIIKKFSDLYLNSGIITNTYYYENSNLNFVESVPETLKEIANAGGGNLFSNSNRIDYLNAKRDFTTIPKEKRILIPCTQVFTPPLLSGAATQPVTATATASFGGGGFPGLSGPGVNCVGYFGGIKISLLTVTQTQAPTYIKYSENDCKCQSAGTYKVTVSLSYCGNYCGYGTTCVPINLKCTLKSNGRSYTQEMFKQVCAGNKPFFETDATFNVARFYFSICPEKPDSDIYAAASCGTTGKDCDCWREYRKEANSGHKGCKCECPPLPKGCGVGADEDYECKDGSGKIEKIRCPSCVKDCGECKDENPPCACCPDETGGSCGAGCCCCPGGQEPIPDGNGRCICVAA
jgi:hypothetical protein